MKHLESIVFLALSTAALGAPALAQGGPGSGAPGDAGGDDGDVRTELERLRARVDVLEQGGAGTGAIDLSGAPVLPGFGSVSSADPLARPWWQNVHLSGYVAAGFLDSGGTGLQPDGTFLVDQASLFIDAEVAPDASVFVELQLVRYKYDYDDATKTGEVYTYLQHLFADEGEDGIGVKVGRIELPFGEEYLHVDAPDNPLITNSAGQVYAVDEGVLLHGSLGPVDWFGSISNGDYARSFDDDPSRTVVGKVAMDVGAGRVSLSGARTGETAQNAFLISGKTARPVGNKYASTAGASPSGQVDLTLWELNGEAPLGEAADVAFAFGGGTVDDDVSAFDRDLTWFFLQPTVQVAPNVCLALRYSEIGTYDNREGYMFDGMIQAFGRSFGYDTSRLQRVSVGVEWSVHPNASIKVEVGKDRFELIDGSPFSPNNDERVYAAVELVGVF